MNSINREKSPVEPFFFFFLKQLVYMSPFLYESAV